MTAPETPRRGDGPRTTSPAWPPSRDELAARAAQREAAFAEIRALAERAAATGDLSIDGPEASA